MHNFVILEKSAGLGGPWWDNSHPGAHVDVPAPLHSFSFAPNPHWRRRFAAAAEIQAGMQQVAAGYRLARHPRLNTRLAEAVFDAASGCRHFITEVGARLRARFFVGSTGPLSQARWPASPGWLISKTGCCTRRAGTTAPTWRASGWR